MPRKPFRPSFRLAAAAAVLVAAGGLTACSSDAGGATSDTLRVGYIGTADKLTGTLGYLQDKGELATQLADLGVKNVKTFGFPNGPDLNQALAAGDLDVGIYGDTPAIVGRAAGQKTRLVGQSTINLDAEIVTKKNGPTSLKGLDGQTVSVAKGSYMHRYLLGAIADAGIKPAQVLNIPTADTAAALEKGDVAAAALPIANAEALRAKGFPIIDGLVKDHPSYAGTSVEVVTQSYLDSHKNFVAVWQAAHRKAVTEAKADWNAYLAFAHTLASFPPAIIDATTLQDQIPADPFTPDGLKLLHGTQDFLVDQKLAAKAFSIDDWIAPGAGT